MKTKTSNQAGFTLVEIMIVVAIIGILAAIAIPNFVRARATSQTNACINNLRQIDSAAQQWALETKQATNAQPAFSDISSYMKSSVVCPAGGNNATFASTYTLVPINEKPLCKIVPSHICPPDTSN